MNLMTNLFENQEVRAILIEKEPWFVGYDVAKVLGYRNTRDAVIKHVWEKNRRFIETSDIKFQPSRNATPEKGNNYGIVFINEPGVYQLIFGSKLETAQKFQDWVFTEVLPNIRRQGFFSLKDDKDLVAYLLKRAANYDHYIEDVLIPVLKKQTEFSYSELFEILSEGKAEKPKDLRKLDTQKREENRIDYIDEIMRQEGFPYKVSNLSRGISQSYVANHLATSKNKGHYIKRKGECYFDEYLMNQLKESRYYFE